MRQQTALFGLVAGTVPFAAACSENQPTSPSD